MIRTLLKRCRQALVPQDPKPQTHHVDAVRDSDRATPPDRPQKRRQAGKRGQRGRRAGKPKKTATASWDRSQYHVPVEEGKTRFHDLDLPDHLLHAIADLGFQYLTPIQKEILQETLTGRDAAGRAQTGTGKTAAFLLTILTRFLREPLPGKRGNGTPRALILAPTRELVMQIVEDARLLAKYAPISVAGVYGGVDYEKQQHLLTNRKIDIVAATPGRLLDFYRKKIIHLNRVEILVIDEADRMLDMGFIPDVQSIVHSTPRKDRRQTLLFSATLTAAVTRLSAQWTRNPVMVAIEPEQVVTDTVDQVVYLTTINDKFALLYNLITRQNLQRVIVFCNRKDETRRLHETLQRYDIDCAMLSGDVPQNRRARTLARFKKGDLRVLVATDVAGRGIHVDGISHVVNYTLPEDPESYVHRIGRTGRAGESGTSVSFADESDSFCIPDIEAFIGNDLHCIHPDDDWLELPPPVHPYVPQKRRPTPHAKKRGKGRRPSRKRSTQPRSR